MMRHVLFVMGLLLGVAGMAQTVTKATSQQWAGGPCCKSGTDYRVYITTGTSNATLEIEEVWLADYGLLQGWECSTEPATAGCIGFGISHDDSSRGWDVDDWGEDGRNTQEADTHLDEMPDFDGVALLLVNINGKQYELVVTRFTELAPVAYP